ncbi:MAG: sigma-70 family RNA polymerase sigma factor [Planctomycetes bacterium]|nr:sigma-70 family RNA polymerase sigma factor [Planctomycetota bacterium]
MTTSPEPDPVAAWHEHAGFVRALARHLALDPHLADDAVQDAWLRALRGPGPRPGRWRAWITSVLHHLVASHHRRATRQARLLATAPPPPNGADEPAAALARLEAHEAVVAAVRDLGEPYRTTILLRWFEGLPPRAIAARVGVPVRTVHTRLQRALAQLRARLHDRDPRWPAVLLLARSPDRASAATTFAMTTTTTKVGLGAGACAAVIAALTLLPDRDAAPRPAVAADASPRATTTTTAHAEAPPAPVVRDAATAATVEPAPQPAEPWPLAGVVLDVDGRPVGRLDVTFTAFGADRPTAHAASAPDGRFALLVPAVSGGHVGIDDPNWTAAYRAVLWGEREVGELTIVVAPAAPVAGIVVDGAGTPVAGADVNLTATLPPRARFGRSLERALDGEWRTTTRADGTFTLPAAPLQSAAQIHAQKPGHRDAHAELTVRTGVRLVLPASAVLEGRVVDRDGQPVAVAVFCHPAGTMSDADGHFRLDLTHVQSRWLVAARGGDLPARFLCPTERPERAESWPQPIELQLGGAPLSIAGHVFDADGNRVPSPSVRLLDPECLVPGNELSSIEFLARVQSQVTANGAQFADHGLQAALWGNDGFFVGGLQDRSYRLRIEVRETLQRIVTAPIQAGTHDLALHLPPEPMWPGVGGAVVDRRGAPVPGASVWIEGPATRDPDAPPLVGGEPPRTATMTTDADGRFAHGPLVRTAGTLLVQAPGIAWPTRFKLAQLGDTTRLQVAAPVATPVRIAATHAGDRATFHDARGTAIGVTITQGDRAWGATDVPLVDGQSEVIAVPDDATTLVLWRGDHEVGRVPVDLRPGAVQVLQP